MWRPYRCVAPYIDSWQAGAGKLTADFVGSVLGNQTDKTPEGVPDLLNKIVNFTAERKFSLSGKTDEFERETDEPEDAPEDDNERGLGTIKLTKEPSLISSIKSPTLALTANFPLALKLTI